MVTPMRKLLCLALCFLSGPVFSAADPYSSVKQATEDLLQRLVAVQPLFKTDQKEFFRQVEMTLGPFIDFTGFSKSVMAKYYRRATDEQKQQFAVVFRRQLIATYATALVEFDNQKVVVLKPGGPRKKPDRARINLEVHSNNGAIYRIDYDLVLIEEEWKLRNLVIEGINIGLQFKSQFSASMQKHPSNIDAVIADWSVDA